MEREKVEATPRTSVSKARRLRIYLACEGRCYMCGCKVPMAGTVIEHPTMLWLGGSDQDSDLRLACGPCVKIKDAKDAGIRAKVKRLIASNDPDRERKPSRLQGRGFEKGPKKAWPKRGWDKRKPT